MKRCSDGPDPPARPEEKQCAGMFGQLPGDDVVAPDPCGEHSALARSPTRRVELRSSRKSRQTAVRRPPGGRPGGRASRGLPTVPGSAWAGCQSSTPRACLRSCRTSRREDDRLVVLGCAIAGRTYRRGIANLTPWSSERGRVDTVETPNAVGRGGHGGWPRRPPPGQAPLPAANAAGSCSSGTPRTPTSRPDPLSSSATSS